MTIQINGTTVIDINRRLSNIRLTTVSTNTNTSAIAGTLYISTNSITLTLPSSPQIGDQVGFSNQSNLLTTIINNNGSRINGLNETMTVDVPYASMTFVYIDSINGWVIN